MYGYQGLTPYLIGVAGFVVVMSCYYLAVRLRDNRRSKRSTRR